MIALPVGIFAPLGLAVLMNHRQLKGTMTFRSLFYMPYIVPFVAAVFLWGGMLNPATGWVNRFLRWVGVANENLPLWANSGAGEWGWIYATYVIMGIWGIGNAMLIMIAGLQGVPTELYDAATVDGANGCEDRVLEITTMCGHHQVGTRLTKAVVERVKAGKMTPEAGSHLLAQPCPCGIFNTRRSNAILASYRKEASAGSVG